MNRRKQLETIIVLVLFLLVLARWQRSWNYVYAGGALLFLSLAWPLFSKNLALYWMKLGEGMGFISGKILLTAVYVLIVLPVSFFARRGGKLNIRLKPRGKTNYKDRDHTYSPADFQDPW
ncbi:hypothetical protein ACX0G9_10615 [Flavitalea flava]